LQAKIESERTKPKSTRRRVFMRLPRESPRFGPRLLPERVVAMSPETIRESRNRPLVSSPFRNAWRDGATFRTLVFVELDGVGASRDAKI
jgi:hypothetical protein